MCVIVSRKFGITQGTCSRLAIDISIGSGSKAGSSSLALAPKQVKSWILNKDANMIRNAMCKKQPLKLERLLMTKAFLSAEAGDTIIACSIVDVAKVKTQLRQVLCQACASVRPWLGQWCARAYVLSQS